MKSEITSNNKTTDNENVDNVRRTIANARPGQSVRELAMKTDLTKSYVHRILKKTLNFKPWRPIRCHALKQEDYAKRRDFALQMLALQNNEPDLFKKIMFSDEASFFVNGCVTLRNCYFWGEKNPKILFKKTVGKERVTVWCGMTADRLIGPFLLNDTMNADRYLRMLEEDVWPLIRNEQGLKFMQDGAPPHFANRVRQWLDIHFQNKWIGRGGPIHWPARSPDLTPCDFFFYGDGSRRKCIKQCQGI